MSRIATISPVWGCSVSDLRELASEAEKGGFEGIFSPEVPPFSALANAQVFAEATTDINVGTWITNIYMREAVMCAATALTIQEINNGGMILGLGVSHKPVNDRYEIDMGDPVESMRDYVGQVKAFMDGTAPQLTLKRDLPKVPVYIAGLTKGAATLAGEVADGLMPYMATPGYVKELRGFVADGAAKAGRDHSGQRRGARRRRARNHHPQGQGAEPAKRRDQHGRGRLLPEAQQAHPVPQPVGQGQPGPVRRGPK